MQKSISKLKGKRLLRCSALLGVIATSFSIRVRMRRALGDVLTSLRLGIQIAQSSRKPHRKQLVNRLESLENQVLQVRASLNPSLSKTDNTPKSSHTFSQNNVPPPLCRCKIRRRQVAPSGQRKHHNKIQTRHQKDVSPRFSDMLQHSYKRVLTPNSISVEVSQSNSV